MIASSAPRRTRNTERGFVTIQILALCVFVLIPMGGVALDLWRAYGTQQTARANADAAAAAGATAIDPALRRATGKVELNGTEARRRACAVLERANSPADCASIQVQGNEITVTATKKFSFTLLKPFVSDPDPTASASSTATPR